MSNWIKNLLGIIILAFLIWYLSRHWSELRVLLSLKVVDLLLLYALSGVVTISNSFASQQLMKSLNVKVPFWEIVLLQNASALLNYVPMKFGTIFQGRYLKRHYNLSYAHYVAMFVYLTFLMVIATAMVSLVILFTVYGFRGYENKILAAFFATLLLGSLIFLFLPLPVPDGSGIISTTIRRFLTGRSTVSKNSKVIIICTGFSTLALLAYAVQIGIIYRSIGQNLHPGGYLILGALGFTSLVISLTPGALGIRELVLGAGAVALGVPLEVGILAAVFQRAVILIWAFVVGGGCVMWLWHKYPADFSESKNL